MDDLIGRVKNGQKVKFAETMAYVQENYHYRQVTFSNGLGKRKLVNQPGENEGSLRIFSLGKLLNLSQKETLALFGELYWRDVIENPDGDDHVNIRNFIEFGWEEVSLSENALTPR